VSWETDYEQDSFSLCHSAVANGRPAVGQDVRYNFDKAADFFEVQDVCVGHNQECSAG